VAQEVSHPRGRLPPSQDALLSVQGVRPEAEHEPHHNPVYGLSHAAAAASGVAASQPFTLHNVDQSEQEQVERLYNTLVAAKKKAGEKCLRRPRFLLHLRAEENRANPQTVPLRRRGILRRTHRRPRQAEGQGEA